MKAERLLAILNLILNKRKISASSLAKKFEVSIRTIYRDVDALASAGIPVYATPGRNGGFEIMEGFTLDRQALQKSDIIRILAGLENLHSILPLQETSATLEKYRLLLRQTQRIGQPSLQNRIYIEMSPSTREKQVIESINNSIEQKTPLSINYSDTESTETKRIIEPAALVYIWRAWYVFAWCRLRHAFRLFKTSRIYKPVPEVSSLQSPTVDLESRPWLNLWRLEKNHQVIFTVMTKAKTAIYEHFTTDEITENPDNTFTVTTQMPDSDWTISFLMSLPGGVTILQPHTLREKLKTLVFDVFQKNTDTG